jgi:hypothetical protein
MVRFVTFLWIAFDVAICLRTGYMTAPFPRGEWWAWLLGGGALALFALGAEYLDRKSDRAEAADLRDRLIRQEGFTAGAFTALGKKLDDMAVQAPQLREEVAEIQSNLRLPIVLQFKDRDPFVIQTPTRKLGLGGWTQGPSRVYVRVFPECTELIEGIGGYLLSIYKKENEEWRSILAEACPLTWANLGAGRIAIHPGLGPYLDVLYVEEGNDQIIPCIPDANRPLRLEGNMPRLGVYRFDVQVTNSSPIALLVRPGTSGLGHPPEVELIEPYPGK